MGRVDGKVAFITGAARGQGRAHAIRLAQEGADIIAVDIDQQVETSLTPTATAADLDETVKLVEELDRRILARTADVRDLPALRAVVEEGVAEFGRLDVVCANAGIGSAGVLWELEEHVVQEMLDINLMGVWKTIRATVPILVEQGTGGSVILTSSVAGVQAYANLGHYVAAKHGVTGLMRSLALEGAPHGIRCNSVHPTTVRTPMIDNPAGYELFTGGVEGATREDMEAALLTINALRVPWVEAVDISNMVLFLASDESRYITGTTQLVDAGTTFPFRIPPG
jgi:SDR family mycofactocin-dependent oxidoreductase